MSAPDRDRLAALYNEWCSTLPPRYDLKPWEWFAEFMVAHGVTCALEGGVAPSAGAVEAPPYPFEVAQAFYEIGCVRDELAKPLSERREDELQRVHSAYDWLQRVVAARPAPEETP